MTLSPRRSDPNCTAHASCQQHPAFCRPCSGPVPWQASHLHCECVPVAPFPRSLPLSPSCPSTFGFPCEPTTPSACGAPLMGPTAHSAAPCAAPACPHHPTVSLLPCRPRRQLRGPPPPLQVLPRAARSRLRHPPHHRHGARLHTRHHTGACQEEGRKRRLGGSKRWLYKCGYQAPAIPSSYGRVR